MKALLSPAPPVSTAIKPSNTERRYVNHIIILDDFISFITRVENEWNSFELDFECIQWHNNEDIRFLLMNM